jgi:hypothetical protein
LQRFRDQVADLYRKLDGVAVLDTLEGQSNLRPAVNHLGHAAVSGIAVDIAGTGNRLHSSLAIDQTYLPGLLGQLDALCPNPGRTI